EKAKYKNNLRGSWFSWFTTSAKRAKLKAAKHAKEYLRVLEFGEDVLARNPWDTRVQLDMAEAAQALGLLDTAIWILEQSRQKNPQEMAVNRLLAQLYEKRGNFTQAIALWELVRKSDPTDLAAFGKAKDLAASEAIARIHQEEKVDKAKETTSDAELGLQETQDVGIPATPQPEPVAKQPPAASPEPALPPKGA